MKIAFGCDHAGFNHKNTIIENLRSQGHMVIDFGCNATAGCDYPDIASAVARSVSSGETDRGILLCGTGIGMSIAANKLPGIRAAVCWADEIAPLISEHNDANVICLPARFATPDRMVKWIDTWMKTPASREERHVQRVGKIMSLENKRGK